MRLRRKMGGLALASVGCLGVLAAGCGSSSGNAAAAGGKAPLKIGVLTEQTGQFSWFGTDTERAAKLWATTVNKKGGIDGQKVQLVTYNTQSSPVDAAQGYKSLSSRGVAAVVGLGLLGDMQAVAPLTANGPVVYSNCGLYSPQGEKNVFAGQIFIPELDGYVLNWLKQNHITKVGLITTNDATGQATSTALTKLAPKDHLQLVGQEFFDPTSTDVTPQLSKLKAAHAQAILALVVGQPLGMVLQGIHELGIMSPVITSEGNLTPAFLQSLSQQAPKDLLFSASQDMSYGDLPSGTPGKSQISAFDTLYQKAYSATPGLGASSTWDELNILGQAIKSAHSTKASAIDSAIENIHHYVGLQGVYDFSQTDHRGLSLSSAVMLQYKNGKLVYASKP